MSTLKLNSGSGSVSINASSSVTSNITLPLPLQVKQTVFTTAYSDYGSTFQEVTGFNVSITPSSTTNRILILARVSICGYTNSARMAIQLYRGSTAIHTASNVSNRIGAASAGQIYGDNSSQDLSIMYVDSPGSTSQQTYKIYAKGEGSLEFYINRSSSDVDSNSVYRTVSSIIAMEVAP